MKQTLCSIALVVLIGTAAFAQNSGNARIAVINQKESGIFKVIYEGSSEGKVRMSITDKNKDVIFDDVNTTSGFMRKVNFQGMEPGEYTIQIADRDGKESQTIVYGLKKSTVKDVKLVKVDEAGKYLLAVTNETPEQIHVNIFDGYNNLVHSSDLMIEGQLKVVYNLQDVSGVPTFQVLDGMGNIRALARK